MATEKANTSDKKRIMNAYDVPFSRAQMINEMAVMSFDIYELFDEPSKDGEAMECDCENKKDIPSEYQRDLFIKRGKALYKDVLTQPIDYAMEDGYKYGDSEIRAMCDFVADDIEYINDDGSIDNEAGRINTMNRLAYLDCVTEEEDVYGEVDVNSLFDCNSVLCPLKIFLDRQECYTIKRKKGEGWFFPFDMRSVAKDTGAMKQHIIAHRTAGHIETGVRATIEGRKMSGIFILK